MEVHVLRCGGDGATLNQKCAFKEVSIGFVSLQPTPISLRLPLLVLMCTRDWGVGGVGGCGALFVRDSCTAAEGPPAPPQRPCPNLKGTTRGSNGRNFHLKSRREKSRIREKEKEGEKEQERE